MLKAMKIRKCMIGIGPMKKKEFDYFNKIMDDYTEAKKMAVAKFLSGYLWYDHDKLSDIDITDTKVSGKNIDILYIVMESPSKVRISGGGLQTAEFQTLKLETTFLPSFMTTTQLWPNMHHR